MGRWRLLLIIIREDIFMLSSKIELMKNANEIKECLGASSFFFFFFFFFLFLIFGSLKQDCYYF